jgi:RHS repeat-associated protein
MMEKEQEIKASSSQFQKTDGVKTKSNAIDVPSISLPKGGGAIKGIDEKFSVNAVNGTVAFSIPLPTSRPRNDFSPSLALNYNSGSGNSIFGLGWNCEVPYIQRKTDKQLPRYEDDGESDVFLFSGMEDLVPAMKKDTGGHWIKDEFTSASGEFVKRYKSRTEGGFARIEKITPAGSKVFYWRITWPNNVVVIFGRSTSAQVANPSDNTRIFRWLPELSFDDRGNCFEYEYVNENFLNVEKTLHESNRFNHFSPCINTYLKRIKHGNTQPYSHAPSAAYDPPAPVNAGYAFETVFDYGDHNEAVPSPAIQKDWLCRVEPFSDYKPGFEIRTYRLCNRILFFHIFKELNKGEATLVRSIDIVYRYFNNPAATLAEKRNTEADYIISVTQSGYKKNKAGGYYKKSLPPVEFTYQELAWNKTVREISPENIVNAPSGPGNNYRWVDLWSEGIPGLLTEESNGWFYKSNLGEGNFSAAKRVMPKPSFSGLQNGILQMQDLEADGRKFLVSSQPAIIGYFEINDEGGWQPFQTFDRYPNIDFADPNTKFIDLNGDGRPDVIVSEENVFTWFESKGIAGYDSPQLSTKPFDEEHGPALVFADPTQSIFLADFSGDGMTDIVRIRNGEVCYWPNLGYGRFGAKVTMDDAPLFDLPDQFNASYLHLSDVSGTGATDILYLGRNQFNAWLNLSGNRWSEKVSVDPFPSTELPNQLSVTDLLGNGTSCIVWSSPLPANTNAPMRYIDLMGGKKPCIMNGYKNNAGKEVNWEFKSSSHYYLQDKQAGTPWVTKLPFPVQCVSKVKINDLVAGSYYTNEYNYHHGYYDSAEREYRGFGRVEETDTEDFASFVLSGATNVVEKDLHQSPVKTTTWFHTGAWVNEQRILDQYSHEYNVGSFEFGLPQPLLPDGLTADEYREAFRACKGMMLRREIYGLDGNSSESNPYSVSIHNCVVKLLQPKLDNKFAVFYVHESESATFYYERKMDDPRIAHTLNLEVEDFGYVLKSASVVYGRKTTDAMLPSNVQSEQKAVHVIVTENTFTKNPLGTDKNVYFDLPVAYRLKSLAKTKTYELTSNTYNAKSQFSIADLLTDFSSAAEIKYEDTPNGSLQKRMIEDVQVIYLNNDLVTPLPFQKMDTLGLSYQSYRKALTPSMVTLLYSGKVTSHILEEGKYIQADTVNWWIPSGRNVYIQTGETVADAIKRFYLPVSIKDPFDTETKLYYDDYHLLLVRTEDALLNTSSVESVDYRCLSPSVLKDMNSNFSEVIRDELGLVIATSVYGDESDGIHGDKPLAGYSIIQPADLTEVITNPHKFLQKATSFYFYDLYAWVNRRQPLCFASIIRETHESELTGGAETKVFLSVGYTSGSGQNLQTKVQAEPGVALHRNNITHSVETIDTTPDLRWVGNGRTILNNKGKPVKQYEPFFSSSYEFEDEKALVEIGFSSLLYYDPLGRNFRIEHPDGTLSRIEFDAWKQSSFDENDTVLESSWYADRGSPNPVLPEPADPETRAAWLAAHHADTSTEGHFDSLGRTLYTIADNGTAGKYETFVVFDIENNQRKVIDARKNVVMQYDYDMVSRMVHQTSMDSGERLLFNDAVNNPVYRWDSRNQRFRTEYDVLHRPANQWLNEDITKLTAADILLPVQVDKPQNKFEKLFAVSVYGENQVNDVILNLRGKAFQVYDQSGLLETAEYDFKGNVKTNYKQFCSDYRNVVDWNVVNKNSLLGLVKYSGSSRFDATNRPTELELPDGSKIMPSFNEANLLEKVDVFIKRQGTVTQFIKNIDYNAKGQRERILYGNGILTGYSYEEKTYRLKRLLTTRNSGADILQDLIHTFDPVGNITQIADNAQQTIFFNNSSVKPVCKYEYDAIYRLTRAVGREHIGQNAACDQFDSDKTQNGGGNRLVLPGDMNAMQIYEQLYDYDEAGNMMRMIHNAGSGIFSNKWTRIYSYEPGNNRLKSTKVGATATGYSYDAHGNMQNLQNGTFDLVWNYADQLQQIDLGGGGKAYYVYDHLGQRVRKVIENGGLIKEHIYLGHYEVYRERLNGTLQLERETLHVMDDRQRIALIETLTVGEDNGSGFLIRYQYSNHLGTSCLEAGQSAEIISYEEYYPFGSTAYQATLNQTEIPKRYRYTGKERDEESGLYYHGARYYAPWLARWSAADPVGIKDGINDYVYCSNNPVLIKDVKGTDGEQWKTTYDANGTPVYSSTGDQATKDVGKTGLAVGKVFLDSDQFNALKKRYLDPRLNELKLSLKTDWDKDKVPMIIGGTLILVPTAVVLGAIAVKNPKLDVPVVGEFYPRQGVAALASAGVGALTEELTDERFKLTFSYEKKDGKDVYGFEITLKGKKTDDTDKKDKADEKKSPEKTGAGAGDPLPAKTTQQKQEEQLKKDINAPASVTVGGTFGVGGGGGANVKIEGPTSVGRFSVAPALTVTPQGKTSFVTNIGLTTSLLGSRLQVGASVFVNAPASKDSPYDVKYDDAMHTATVTTMPPLTGSGATLGLTWSY